MNQLDGQLIQFSSRDKNLLAFISPSPDSQLCSNALVFIAGQTDGFLSLNYAVPLAGKLATHDCCLIQVNLESSFLQFGFKSLQSDTENLTDLVGHMKEKYHVKNIYFMGSSTGCQDILYFLRRSPLANAIQAVILQGAVSDRDYITTLSETPGMLEEARRYKANNQLEICLTKRYFDAPITASRYLSLAERLGDDDMFSIDLTEPELFPLLSCVKVPIALCFSRHDEYVPNHDGQKLLAEKMVRILQGNSPRVECQYFDGDHMLTRPEHYQPFIDYVAKFISLTIQ